MADDTKRGVIVNRMGAFVAIPITFINDTRITNAGRCLYMLLCSYTSAKADEPIAFPSYETIMERLDWHSTQTVAVALLNLLRHGWVERKRRYGSSSVYTINYAPAASPLKIEGLTFRKSKDSSFENQTTDTLKSADQLEVLKQEVPQPEVARRGTRKTRALSGFASGYTSHDDPRVAAFLEILARKHITATEAEIIQKRVSTDTTDVFRGALEVFAANPNWRIDLAAILDRYDRMVNAKRFSSNTAAPSYQNGHQKNAAPWTADGAMEILRARAAARGETI